MCKAGEGTLKGVATLANSTRIEASAQLPGKVVREMEGAGDEGAREARHRCRVRTRLRAVRLFPDSIR
jgi:hypothetical protein